MYEYSPLQLSTLATPLIFREILLFSSLSNGAYKLKNNESLEEYQVYCHMTEITGCGSGGWTLVMKIDGEKVKTSYIEIILVNRNIIVSN